MSKRPQYLQLTFKGFGGKCAHRQDDEPNEAKCTQLVNLQKVHKGLTKTEVIKLINKTSFLLERWDRYTYPCSSH